MIYAVSTPTLGRRILNYFRMPIHNGTVEGLNNKAKLVIHKA